MRREYTMTSPEQLYPDRERVRSPYLSPKNNANSQQGVYSSFKSPSHRHEDNFDKKYPTSSKYNRYEQLEYRPQPQYHSPEPSQSIEISELRLTISQLRSSLQATSQNSQRLQEELFMQRSKNVELSEVRRRLQEQLSRMEFQLDRIGNYDALETRQTNIKLTNALRENSRLSQQVADLIDQMKVLKNEQRRLMSECDTLLKEKQVLMGQNQTLLQKLQLLEGEVRQVKQEVAIHSQQSIRLNQNALPSRVNNLHTVRTYQASTINNSPRPMPTVHSRHSIDLEQLPQQMDYQAENQKLLSDYQRLLEENQSMKDLYNNFYQAESKPTPIPQMNMQTFSNKAIAQQLNSQRDDHKNENNKGIMLKTMQKKELKKEMNGVRDEALGELTKIYIRAVEKANSQRKNCLKVFIHELVKNKQIYAQMAENYLKLRMTIMEETGLKLPEKYEEGAMIGQREKMVLQMYKSVKDKSKSQNEVGTALAVFRLITLMVKAGGISPTLSDNIKHSILKYVYKLAQNERINTDP